MREYSTPLSTEIPGTGNLTDDVVVNGREYAEQVVFSRYIDGSWADVTAAQFLAEVTDVAKGLVAAGLEAGDRVALISRTRYEWTTVDYAIWFAGCVTVPIYDTSSPSVRRTPRPLPSMDQTWCSSESESRTSLTRELWSAVSVTAARAPESARIHPIWSALEVS